MPTELFRRLRMTESNGATSRFGSVAVPLGVAVLGFAAQVLWFSTQFGGITARTDELERRLALIEQVGSPALVGMHAQVEELLRRANSIEQGGSPALQGLRTQIEVNTRRLDELSRMTPDAIARLGAESAMHSQILTALTHEVERLRDWRVQQTDENKTDAARDAVQDRSLASLTDVVANLQQQFQEHRARDSDDATSVSALRQALESVRDDLNHLRDLRDGDGGRAR